MTILKKNNSKMEFNLPFYYSFKTFIYFERKSTSSGGAERGDEKKNP